jgi:hypothetical protein
MVASATAATITVGNADDPATGNAANCDVPETCTLRDAIARAANVTGAAAGDTIVFSLPANSTITLSGSELRVDRNLTIDGISVPGLAISGNHGSRVLRISVHAAATFKNLVVRDGNDAVGEGGGGIHNAGTLTLIDSKVLDNIGLGGGIFNWDGSITLIGSVVSGNTATSNGGGIHNIGGIVNLYNSKISENSAERGGGIYNWASGTVNLADSDVSGNAAGGGGGIYNTSNLSHISLINTILSGNSSAASGAGIYNDLGTITLSSGSMVSANTAGQAGGGIYSGGSLTITDGAIIGNVASGEHANGGGIYNQGNSTLTRSTISENMVVNGGGGGIYNRSNQLVLVESTVSNNKSISVGGTADGGGMWNGGTLAVTDSAISNNTTSGRGGGIHNNVATLTLVNSTISDNASASGGGGIWNSSNYYGGTVRLLHCVISGNVAETGAGVQNHGSLVQDDCRISDNISNGDGGGIYNSGSISLSRNIIVGNVATHGDGGAIYNWGSDIVLTDSTISANTAESGGGIYFERGEPLVSNSTVSGNAATSGDGGGIYALDSGLKFINSTASGNSAVNGRGGAVFSFNGGLGLIQSTLAGNTAFGIDNDVANDFLYMVLPTWAVNSVVGACNIVAGLSVALNDHGGNLDGGEGCGFTSPSSRSNATLDLGALADNGGPTLTMMPGAGSDAIGYGLPAACRSAPVNSRDQRGYVRPAVGCTSGAVDPNALENESIFLDGFGFGGQ